MTFTYDLNTNGCLIIRADAIERELLKQLASNTGEYSSSAEWDALESLVCNSELEWIRPEEIGALTDAPILGLRRSYMEIDAPENVNNEPAPNRSLKDAEEVIAAWGYMDYQVRSFVQDLIETGNAVFVS